MSTPPSPEDRPNRGAESPTRKRSHSEMAAGKQGVQRASPVPPTEISSAGSDSSDKEDDSVKPTSMPPLENVNAHEQPETQFQMGDDELDPEQPLKDFDWQELEERYHNAMAVKLDEDQQLWTEFERLMNFFQLWAGTTPHHETDRSFYRLRTRMAHVQNSERELEKKREHYTKVVQAFERALRLLEA
ncbi:zinc finger fyve domain-containing protein 19 [Diplodia corticola]|uniref:Zinc finger fyve domain-containing protein 19 n=1 Tax=Diplodia corticola TaxID=236234 RepID=A0A1J9QR63_9PEZI|nr:zinc finger fyve domain-containing protein 19 [Diplodia corticola]OJD30905.1 zinc finger fyve domain-containing protein 19 [Diplodia corticola]